MINYGVGPAPDEVELVLFGPGYGEAIAAHLGHSHWLLVDSCLDPYARAPASAAYLDAIGVAPSMVKSIVASHWHDDHVRGMSRLADKYPDAEFGLSSAFDAQEAIAFLSAYSGSVAPSLTRGASELFETLSKRDKYFFFHQRSSILDLPLPGLEVKVTALSPVPKAVGKSIAHMASYLPPATGGTPIGHALPLSPNLEAVVIHIDFGGDAILLGADLEDHAEFGWSAVAGDAWCAKKRPATAYKVAHHGSYTGRAQRVWEDMLEKNVHAAVTPFTLGRHRLPTANDIAELKSDTENAWLTSVATRKPSMPGIQLKRLEDIARKIVPVNNGFGAVRLRKKLGTTSWHTDLFGNAVKL